MSARLYFVAYDVAAPRRWRRVQKALRRLCRRQQLSVFFCRGTPSRIAELERELRGVLDPKDDRLMILDFGPADTAVEKIRAMNLMTGIPALEEIVL